MRARKPPPAPKARSSAAPLAPARTSPEPVERSVDPQPGELDTLAEDRLARAERLGHRVARLAKPSSNGADPRTLQRRVFLDWGTSSTEPDVEELVVWLARGGVKVDEKGEKGPERLLSFKESLRRLVDSDDTYRFPWATGQGQLAKTLRRLVPSSDDDEARVGLEIEMGWVQLKTGGTKLGNTELLAVSRNVKGKDIPLLRLEVEGMVKGTPYVEAVFGPVPTRVLATKEFAFVREQLVQCLSKSAPFTTLVGAFNAKLTTGSLPKFKLVVQPSATHYSIKTTTTAEKASPSQQSNVSLPYSKLGQSGSREAGDFADLFESPTDRRLFASAREHARILAAGIPTEEPSGEPGDRRHMASLFTQYLFQETIYRSKVEKRRGEDAKHHFHALIKTSLEDVVFGILSGREVEDLAAWVKITDLAKLFRTILTEILPRRTGPVELETIESVFGTALEARLEQGRRTLPKVEKGADEEAVEISFGKEIVHAHPRPSARIPFVEKDGEYYVVVEQRSKGSFLNDPTFPERKKVEFLTKLQTPSSAQPIDPKAPVPSSRLVKVDRSDSSRPLPRESKRKTSKSSTSLKLPRSSKLSTSSKSPTSSKLSTSSKSPTSSKGTSSSRTTPKQESASSSTARMFSHQMLQASLGRSKFEKLLRGEAKEFRLGGTTFEVTAIGSTDIEAVPL